MVEQQEGQMTKPAPQITKVTLR